MVIKSVVDNLLYGSIMVLVVGGLCFADCPDEIQDVRRTSFPVIAEINPGENVMLPLTLRVCTKKIGERFKRFSASPRDRYEKKLVKILSSISSKNREKLMEMAVHEQKDGRVLMDSDFIKLGINLKIKLHADHVDRETTKIIERINFGDQVLFIVSFMNSDSSERVVDLFVLDLAEI